MTDIAGGTYRRVLSPSLIWRDGALIPFADATVHVLSHMAARGSQIFDVLLVVGGPDGPAALGLREHVARFAQSAVTMGMEGLPDIGALERAVADTVLANLAADEIDPVNCAPLVVKLIASWDDTAMGIEPFSLTPNIYIAVTPWASNPADAAKIFEPGDAIKVKTATMPKIPASILPPSMKVAAGYTPGVRHHLKASAEGYDQVLFKTVDGDMAEGVTSSFFVVRNGRIALPPIDSVLDGVTRRVVLDVAQSLDIPFQVRAVRWEEVSTADELFLSSTIRTVWPVGQLDDRQLDAPGPVSTAVASTLAEVLQGTHALSDRWMTPLVPLASP